jgi:Flp pilus assembly protein TadB
MTNKNADTTEVYEEAEIVRETRGSSARTQAGKYARNTTADMQRQIVFQGLGAIFIFLFALFVVVALIFTLLFWLLPFALAALIVTFLIALVVAGYQSLRNFLGK